jgi:hypothetical protein
MLLHGNPRPQEGPMCGYLYLEAREALADLMRNYDAANFTLMIRPVRILTKIFFSQHLRISYHTRRQTVGQIRKANPISSIAAKSRRHATEARRVLRVPQWPRPKMMDNSKATEYVAALCRGMAGLYRMIPSALPPLMPLRRQRGRGSGPPLPLATCFACDGTSNRWNDFCSRFS